MKRALLSVRERIWPGTIERLSGFMADCERCGEPYRHMRYDRERFLCGRCGTINLAPNIERVYVNDTPPGD
jgi:ribosomal protein S27AE